MSELVLLGVGHVGRAIAGAAGQSRQIIGTTRHCHRLQELERYGVKPLYMSVPDPGMLAPICAQADVVVTFPPDGITDRLLAPALTQARRMIYISSTGVYGKIEGIIDDTTPTDSSEPEMQKRLEAEAIWQQVGAVVLRVPGIYGPESGLHLSLKSGRFRIPGNGNRYTSRIHVADLASIILAMLAAPRLQDNCYVVGDLAPCTQKEIATWLCTRMNLPLPPSAPLNEVSRTLRGNLRIDPSRILQELAITLRYPDYKAGYESILTVTTGTAARPT